MSYDDTLSVALELGFNDTAAVFPIHGGILSLCGEISGDGAPRVGIDTLTGYARALRFYLNSTLTAEEYASIDWVFAGAFMGRRTCVPCSCLYRLASRAPAATVVPRLLHACFACLRSAEFDIRWIPSPLQAPPTCALTRS